MRQQHKNFEPENVCHYCGKQAYKSGSNYLVCYNRADTGNCDGYKPIIKEAEQQNNEPCKCGSGKKYKKCCKRATVKTINDEAVKWNPL